MRLSLLTFFLFTGCAYSIHQVQVSEFKPHSFEQRGQHITATAEQFTIMGFITQNDYVDLAYKRLADKCPGGEVSGITNQFSTKMGFFSWHNKILLQGLCTQAVASAEPGSRHL